MGVAAALSWVPARIHPCARCPCRPCRALGCVHPLCWLSAEEVPGRWHSTLQAPRGAELTSPGGVSIHRQRGWGRAVVVACGGGDGGGTWREWLPLPERAQVSDSSFRGL